MYTHHIYKLSVYFTMFSFAYLHSSGGVCKVRFINIAGIEDWTYAVRL